MRRHLGGLSIVALLVLSGCGSTNAVTRQKTEVVAGATVDQAFVASVQALGQIGFVIKNSDKASGLLVAEGGRNALTQNEAPQLSILVSPAANGASVSVTAIQPGQLVDYGAGNKNITRFLAALKTTLPPPADSSPH